MGSSLESCCRYIDPAELLRHERASTVLTSNKGFEEWGAVLGDEVMAAAPIDHVLHHYHIVNIRGNSYRTRGASGCAATRSRGSSRRGRSVSVEHSAPVGLNVGSEGLTALRFTTLRMSAHY